VTTYFYFEYGLTTSYGSITSKSFPTGTTPLSLSNVVAGLQLQTLYHFRAVATNSTGNSYGNDLTLTTLGTTTPTISTNYVSTLGATNVTFAGKFYAGGLPAGAWFEYGLTTNYGTVTSVTNLGGGTTNQNFKLAGGVLSAGSTYYFRAVATNSLGTNYGVGQTFLTTIFGEVTTIVAPGLPAVYDASVTWGDFNNDGQMDFLISGIPYMTNTEIWQNTGSGFTNVTASIAAGLSLIYQGSMAWGDYDNDGLLDLILTGYGNSQIWHNTGSNFVNVTATVAPGLPGLSYSSVAWGDYDNDGRLDFIIIGQGATTNVAQIWHNTGSNFVNVTASVAPGFPGVNGFTDGCVAWGDYDNDGRLDFIVSGSGGVGGNSYFLQKFGITPEATLLMSPLQLRPACPGLVTVLSRGAIMTTMGAWIYC
jgi:hypothetical protein